MSPSMYLLLLPKSLHRFICYLFFTIVYLYINIAIYMNVTCIQTCIYCWYMNKCYWCYFCYLDSIPVCETTCNIPYYLRINISSITRSFVLFWSLYLWPLCTNKELLDKKKTEKNKQRHRYTTMYWWRHSYSTLAQYKFSTSTPNSAK